MVIYCIFLYNKITGFKTGNTKQTMIFIISAILVNSSVARECYICGIGPSDPLFDIIVADKLKQQHHSQQGATNIGHNITSPMESPYVMSCTQFDEQSAEHLSKFVAQCPVGYMGCLAQWDGKCGEGAF